ncbi:MAG: DUF3109 family protein [Bacteroidia bacterium]|nr:DUF3109 family protein [Bacteroidia bacterium]
MIAIQQTLISEDIFEKNFVCNLNACKGECCVAGDSGAPLDKEELEILDKLLPVVEPYLTNKGKVAIKKQGAYVIDEDGDYTTTLVSEGAECAFVFFDEKNIAKCAIEQAYLDGKTQAVVPDWKKPTSCHLYPIRITAYKEYDAVNYHQWQICKDACTLGEELKLPVFKFLKEPLIRKYGKEWYDELELIYQSPEIWKR